MFIDDSTYTRDGKIYRRVLLRNSYRKDGKTRHDTIANLSSCTDAEIDAIKLALRHKENLADIGNAKDDAKFEQGLSVGALLTLQQTAKSVGLNQALGSTRDAKLALWLVFATVIAQGSRLSAVRLAQQHAACDLLDLETFNEDHLYGTLDWLAEHQNKIEESLFRKRYQGQEAPKFYLYDVTSSYFEGTQNELAEYGYNRDGKKGKKQIVIGLMTDVEGWPIAAEVFTGSTRDMKTLPNQITAVAERFGAKEVTFVGDRGMIKSAQIKELDSHNFHYITGITKPQINSLLNKGAIQLSLFDTKVTEITIDGIRYILRKNPTRAEEIKKTREGKLESIRKFITKQNLYLQEHPKAKISIAQKKVEAKIKLYAISKWVEIKLEDRQLKATILTGRLAEESLLDGCYILTSDLTKEQATAEQIHARYKELAEVEMAFRTMKTSLLEIRAIYLRKANRTKAHVFVVMLAYMLVHKLKAYWREIELTTEEAFAELSSICSLKVRIKNQLMYQVIPMPRKLGQALLKKAHIVLPDALPYKNIEVVTRKKLVSERK